MKGREGRFAEALKIELPPPVKDDPKKHRAYVAARDEAMHIAGLVVVNAMMFSSALNRRTLAAKNGERIAPYDGVAPERLKRHWARVEDGINYVSILAPARRLIDAGACDEETLSILKQAADRIRPLAERGVDILGRVFHTVLAQAKTYAAFFTGIPGATLMSEIALDPDRWENVNWRDPESIGELRVCDPACGSGTLIAFAAWKLRRNFRFRVDENRAAKLENLHRLLVEKVIYAADIVPVASHLTATSVALISPEVSFDRSNVFCAPMGVFGEPPKKPEDPDKRIKALGSLAHLAGQSWLSEKDRLDNLGIEVEGGVAKPFPALDVCLMNPPFVRGWKNQEVYDFAGKHKPVLQEELRRMAGKKFRTGGSQGPAFLVLAADRIKAGGNLAVILPSSMATGSDPAWQDCRGVIGGRFDIEVLVVSQDPDRQSFSDSTHLSELMLIARQNVGREKTDDALFVVLRENHCAPDAEGGSREKARQVADAINEAIKSGANRGKVPGGVFARMKWRGKPAWNGINFADIDLSVEMARFGESGIFAGKKLPTAPLDKVARFGNCYLDGRELKKHDLAVLSTPTNFPYYCPVRLRKDKKISNQDNFALVENPHFYLRPQRDGDDWSRGFHKLAGQIVINKSFRFNTSRRLVVVVSEPVQCSTFHPIIMRDEKDETDGNRKAMALWMNSTPMLAMMAATCNQTHGSKVICGQAMLSRIPALDFRQTDGKTVKRLAECFDQFVKDGEVLAQFPAMEHDSARARLDDAVADALGIDRAALADLRRRLAKEPIISNKPYPAPA